MSDTHDRQDPLHAPAEEVEKREGILEDANCPDIPSRSRMDMQRRGSLPASMDSVPRSYSRCGPYRGTLQKGKR